MENTIKEKNIILFVGRGSVLLRYKEWGLSGLSFSEKCKLEKRLIAGEKNTVRAEEQRFQLSNFRRETLLEEGNGQ